MSEYDTRPTIETVHALLVKIDGNVTEIKAEIKKLSRKLDILSTDVLDVRGRIALVEDEQTKNTP